MSNKKQKNKHSNQGKSQKGKDKDHDKMGKFFYTHITLPLKRYIGLVEKEMRTLFNDKAMMLITYAIPIVIIMILTMGITTEWLSNEEGEGGLNIEEAGENQAVPVIGIMDMDDSEGFQNRDLSEEFYNYFKEAELSGGCELYESNNQSEMELMLGEGDLNGLIIIPDLFEFNLSIHLPVLIPFVIDAIDFNMLQSTQLIVNTVIDAFREDNGFKGVFKIDTTNVNLPEGRSQTFFAAAPYLIPLVLFGIGALISTQSIVSDVPKDRMVLTPTNKYEMMAAKVTGNFLVMSTVSLIILITSAAVGLDIKVSWFIYYLCMEAIVLNGVLFGVSLSAISKTPLAAFQYFIFIFLFMAIAVLFIGDQEILNLIPLYNGGELVMNVVLRGQSLWSVRRALRNMLLESLALYVFAFIVFKRQKTML